MIVGVGCDIVDKKVSEASHWDLHNTLQRIFTLNEIREYEKENRINYLMGRFAIKEAVLKCIGSGIHDGIKLTDIETLQNADGAPVITLHDEVKRISSKKNYRPLACKYITLFALYDCFCCCRMS